MTAFYHAATAGRKRDAVDSAAFSTGIAANYFPQNPAPETVGSAPVSTQIVEHLEELDFSAFAGANDDDPSSHSLNVPVADTRAPPTEEDGTREGKRPRGRGWRRKPKREDKRLMRTTLCLTPQQVVEIEDGWSHARIIGRPLNIMLTIRPADNDNVPDAERKARWSKLYAHLDQHCRNGGFPFTAVWSRESLADTDGEGEHWHVLMHVPSKRERDRLEAAMVRRYPGAGEVDLQNRDQKVRRSRNRGVPYSAASYVTKALPPTMRWQRPFYERSGPIFGKRAGVTTNLSAKAIAAWRAGGRLAA